MSTYRKRLPQLDGGLFLTDGGIETDLIFNDGMELPHFAAFDLLKTEKGTAVLRAYYARYATIARANGVGFILESPTWRASADWGRKLGYSQTALAQANAKAIELMARAAAGVPEQDRAHGDQRLRRPARRWLRSGHRDERGRGAGLSRRADRRVRQDRRRHGDGHHHDQRQRGDRPHACGPGRRHAGRHLLHARDRRAAADGAGPEASDRGGGRSNRQRPGLLHDQLRPPHALRGDAGRPRPGG